MSEPLVEPPESAIRRQAIVAVARRFIGTPFVHQQRSPGVGIDCVGVLICAAKLLGLRHEDFREYGREADGAKLEEFLARHCRRVPVDEFLPGHALAFWFEKRDHYQHVAVATGPNSMVHAHSMYSGGAVREESIDGDAGEQRAFSWRDRILSVWELQPW